MSGLFKFTFKEFVAVAFSLLSGLATGTFWLGGFYYQERAQAQIYEKRFTELETDNKEFKKAIIDLTTTTKILTFLMEKERRRDR